MMNTDSLFADEIKIGKFGTSQSIQLNNKLNGQSMD